MKKSLTYLLFWLSICSCKNDNHLDNGEIKLTTNRSSKQFSISSILNKIGTNDSLLITTDIGIGDSWHKEVNVIKNKNNIITIYSINDSEFVNSSEIRTPEKELVPCLDDTLCIEYMINTSGVLNTCDNRYGRLAIIYNKDTTFYCTSTIIQSMKFSNLYIAIKRKLFPEMELYKKIEIPK
jgi:hypothetical protein